MEDEPAARVARRGASAWHISQRSPTLSGNIPLRAAQACTPLLLGNTFGVQLKPPRPIRIRRTWRSLEIEPRPLSARSLGGLDIAVTFDTGLSLRPAPGVVLIVERSYNRRDRRVYVPEVVISTPSDLLLTLRVRLARGAEAVLEGELASLGAFAPAPPATLLPLAEAVSVGRAHLGFFDQAYFDAKRGKPTRKYRTTASRGLVSATEAPRVEPRIEVIGAGDASPVMTRSEGGILNISIPLPLAARVAFHGQRVEARIAEPARRERARHIEAIWAQVFGHEASPDTGAIRYFTTYVTTHTAGDPRLFFKPALLLKTPPDWLAVIDGPAGDGYEVMRGVTEPGWFHAMPGVIEVQSDDVALRAGTPLIRVRPVPRRLVSREIAVEPV